MEQASAPVGLVALKSSPTLRSYYYIKNNINGKLLSTPHPPGLAHHRQKGGPRYIPLSVTGLCFFTVFDSEPVWVYLVWGTQGGVTPLSLLRCSSLRSYKSVTFQSKCFTNINSFNLHNSPVKKILMSSTLLMGKLRPREVKPFAQGDATDQWQTSVIKSQVLWPWSLCS